MRAWGACTATCDIGTTTRTRKVKVADAYGGVPCENGKFPELHVQTVKCNEQVSCSKWSLPKCQSDHVHCDIKTHELNKPRTWMSAIDSNGKRYYHNIVTGQSTYVKPKDFLACSAPPATKWHKTKVVDRGLNKHDTTRYGRFDEKEQQGYFVPHLTQKCINNQNCGLVDLGGDRAEAGDRVDIEDQQRVRRERDDRGQQRQPGDRDEEGERRQARDRIEDARDGGDGPDRARPSGRQDGEPERDGEAGVDAIFQEAPTW